MAFADFPQQQQVVELLQRSLERNRLAHGYLFTGTSMAELEAVAKTLSKTINCAHPRRGPNGQPVDSCDQCDACVRIDADNHPDVMLVRPESKSRVITINQMRELMASVNLKPSVARYKFGIIAGADRMNVMAANSFLKTLEEPPARSVLILLSSDSARLLETILSRCLRLNFSGERQLSSDEMDWVGSFAQAAVKSEGGILARYRLLASLVAKLARQREAIENTLTAASPLERYEDLDPKMREKLEDELAAAIEAEYRRQRADLLAALQLWLRDVWVQTRTTAEDLLHLNPLASLTSTVAARLSPAEALDNVRVIEQLHRMLNSNVQEALTLEVGFLKLKL